MFSLANKRAGAEGKCKSDSNPHRDQQYMIYQQRKLKQTMLCNVKKNPKMILLSHVVPMRYVSSDATQSPADLMVPWIREKRILAH